MAHTSRNIGGGGGEIFNMYAFGVRLRYANLSNIIVSATVSKYEFKVSKYEFKLSKYEFKLSKYEFKLSKYEFKLSSQTSLNSVATCITDNVTFQQVKVQVN